MKEKFERLVTYLAVAGVFFAVFYSLTPTFAENVINPALPYIGPLIVIGLAALAWRKKPAGKQTLDAPQGGSTGQPS
ncbi:MAG: hypothetical protein AAGU05_10680 [Anaerolineaceae bacterium]